MNSIKDVPSGANVIKSHVLYKVKREDDGYLKLKARIDPHGNEDKMKHDFTTDSLPVHRMDFGFLNQSRPLKYGY